MAVNSPIIASQYRLARHYLGKLRAADEAFRRGHENTLDALALFEREAAQIKHWRDWAGSHAADDPEIARLCLQFTKAGEEISRLRESPQEWSRWLEGGLATALALGDQQAEILHLYLLAYAYERLGIIERAHNYAQRAFSLACLLDNALYKCRCLNQMGGQFYVQDEYERAKEAKLQALSLSTTLGAKPEMCVALNGLGNIALSQWDHPLAQEYYTQCLDLAENSGWAIHQAVALYNLGVVSRRTGDYEKARDYAKQSAHLCEVLGETRFFAQNVSLLATISVSQGKLPEARSYFEQSLSLSRSSNNPESEIYTLLELGRLHYQMGNVTTAIEHLDATLALSKTFGERWYGALALTTLAEIAREAGNFPHARQKLREGFVIAQSFESTAIRARYVLHAALIWMSEEQTKQATLWVGLLQNHIHELTTEQRDRLQQLRSTLAGEMGNNTFAATFERGKTLELEATFREIGRQLNAESLVQPQGDDMPLQLYR